MSASANFPVFTRSKVIPQSAASCCTSNWMPKTPMEPVIVVGSAKIRVLSAEIQYPPEAA